MNDYVDDYDYGYGYDDDDDDDQYCYWMNVVVLLSAIHKKKTLVDTVLDMAVNMNHMKVWHTHLMLNQTLYHTHLRMHTLLKNSCLLIDLN